MGRKPYKKVKLTHDEYEVVNKVAHITRCDESWFSIATDEVSFKSHKVLVKRELKEYDRVWDMERKAYVSLQYGLKLLNEAFDASDGNRAQLTDHEQYVWDNLLKRLY